MELKSLEFLFFAFLVIIAYFGVYRIPKAQKYVLLGANTLFIWKAVGAKALILITGLCVVHYSVGICIDRFNEKKNKKKAKLFMWIGVVIAVAVLCYFKFFKQTFILIQQLIAEYGINVSDLITPIGISYYTLSMIAYIVDIYHKKYPAERNFVDFYVFITYFPAIIQGPVNLYKKVGHQFKSNHEPNEEKIVMGLQRILWGYIKKVVIADRIGILVNGVLQDQSAIMFTVFWSMVLYSFQIYTDFSGGIDVIMGFSEMIGIELTENFKSPLVSKNITEYWQRWHRSLGDFMEKYIYYPTVLNRKMMRMSKKMPGKYFQKVFSATLASVIVFIIVGIWHGTGWNYVIYGCYQAFFVSTAVLAGPVYKRINQMLHISEKSITWRLFQALRTFLILVFGRYFIRAGNLTQAFELFRRTFENFRWDSIHVLFDDSLLIYGLDYKNMNVMYIGIIVVIFVDIMNEKGIYFRNILMKQDICCRYIMYFIGIFTIIIYGIYGPEFMSSSFIYQGY